MRTDAGIDLMKETAERYNKEHTFTAKQTEMYYQSTIGI